MVFDNLSMWEQLEYVTKAGAAVWNTLFIGGMYAAAQWLQLSATETGVALVVAAILAGITYE